MCALEPADAPDLSAGGDGRPLSGGGAARFSEVLLRQHDEVLLRQRLQQEQDAEDEQVGALAPDGALRQFHGVRDSLLWGIGAGLEGWQGRLWLLV